GQIVTLSILKAIGEQLVAIHSQHDTLTLLEEKNHLPLLDHFDPKLIKTKESYQQEYKLLDTLQKKYEAITINEQETRQRIDLLEFQINEIDAAQLKPLEESELNEEKIQLQNFEKVYLATNESYQLFQSE